MNLEKVWSIVKNIPFMNPVQWKGIFNLILKYDINNILELGFAHGTSTCYMAAALDEKKTGHIITIDHTRAKNRSPNIEELLKISKLSKYVKPIYAHSTYNWELMKLIEKNTQNGICEPTFDFCYLDWSHNFQIDVCAFFLVDKLLKPGWIILFDDIDWCFGESKNMHDIETNWVNSMSDEEQTIPHVWKIIELVVNQHPNYTSIDTLDGWALAIKK